MEKELYYCKVTWYDDYKEKNETATLLTLANSYSQAAEYTTESFHYVEEIHIEKIATNYGGDVNCIYIDDSKQTFDMIKEYNDY